MRWRDLIPLGLGLAALPTLFWAAEEMDRKVPPANPNLVALLALPPPVLAPAPLPVRPEPILAKAAPAVPPPDAKPGNLNRAVPKMIPRHAFGPDVAPRPFPTPPRGFPAMPQGVPSSPARPMPTLAPAASDLGEAVRINVGAVDGPTSKAINDALMERLKQGGRNWSLGSNTAGGQTWFTVKPVADVQTFADGLPFAKEARVSGRTIDVVVDPDKLK